MNGNYNFTNTQTNTAAKLAALGLTASLDYDSGGSDG